MENTKINLCDTCTLTYPECDATAEDIKFGDGKGFDNVIFCKEYFKSNKKFNEKYGRMEYIE